MVYVLNDLIRDPDLTGIDVATWCFASICLEGVDKRCDYLAANQILCQMYESVDFPPYVLTKIGKSLDILYENGYLKGKCVGKHRYIIYPSSFKNKDGYFSMVEADDLRKIISDSPDNYSFDKLRQYLMILSFINLKKKYIEITLDQFASYMAKDVQTVASYIQSLENLQLIYVYRQSAFNYASNVYGRYSDKDIIDAAFMDKKKLNPTSNDKRRFSQMYNQIKAGNREYPPEIKAQILEYCIKENEKREKLYKKNPKYNKKLFDISLLT